MLVVIIGDYLVVQWLRIHLAMQGTLIWSLVWEDPTYLRATEPVSYNYQACALEPLSCNHGAHHPSLCSATTEAMRWEALHRNQRKPMCSKKDPAQSRINKYFKKNVNKDITETWLGIIEFTEGETETKQVSGRLGVESGWGSNGWGVQASVCSDNMISSWLCRWSHLGTINYWEYTKNYWSVHFKWMLCKLCLNKSVFKKRRKETAW